MWQDRFMSDSAAPPIGTYPYVVMHGDHVAFYLKFGPDSGFELSRIYQNENVLYPSGGRAGRTIMCGTCLRIVDWKLPITKRIQTTV